MIGDDVLAWGGYDVGDAFASDPPLRITVLLTSDFDSWTVIPLGEWITWSAREEWAVHEVQQMSDGRLLVGGRVPSGGALWVVDMETGSASLVASELPGEVRSVAISRCGSPSAEMSPR